MFYRDGKMCKDCGTVVKMNYFELRLYHLGRKPKWFTCDECRISTREKRLELRADEKRYIYVLTDPKHKRIFYVGQTKKPDSRLHGHIQTANALKRYMNNKNYTLRNPKAMYILSLINAGVRPELDIVEETTLAQVGEREIWWIDRLQALGIELTNGKHHEQQYL